MDSSNTDLPSTPSEARERGCKHYFTGKACPRGHIDVRYASTKGCFSCVREKYRGWKKKNPEKMREAEKQWKTSNPERRSKVKKEWYRANAETEREKTREWRRWNPEYIREWCQKNRDLTRIQRVKRRAAKLHRTPLWADHDAIKAVYAEADRLASKHGVEYHVDHVYPLQGETVSGLHVAENLRAIPAQENRSKGNSHPDQYHEGRLADG